MSKQPLFGVGGEATLGLTSHVIHQFPKIWGADG